MLSGNTKTHEGMTPMQDILNLSIRDMRAAMAAGTLTARQLVSSYIARIAKLDAGPEGLHSVSELSPDALFIAEHLDRLQAEGTVLGPLHGIPVMLKDNIDTGDKMSTSAGSRALACNFAAEDAALVKKLRAAGAIILGKTNLSEFAQFLASRSPSGYSSRGGQVVNPYCADETPGGSSSGSGVAVAARFCTAAVGSDTCGSIMSPTAQNGLCGIRPTKGLISCAGVVPISATMDTTGPMARTVADMAVLLGVMAGRDDSDPTTVLAAERYDYTPALENATLAGTRIGVSMSGYDTRSPEEQRAFDALLTLLEGAGAALIQGIDFDMDYQPALDVMECEFAQSLNGYLSRCRGAVPRSLQEVILFNQSNPAVMLKYGQDRALLCQNETTGTLTDVRYLKTLVFREQQIALVDGLLNDNRLDAIVRTGFSTVTTLTGHPSLGIPMGQKENGVPIGVCWIGRRFDEATLIKLAAATEAALNLNLCP